MTSYGLWYITPSQWVYNTWQLRYVNALYDTRAAMPPGGSGKNISWWSLTQLVRKLHQSQPFCWLHPNFDKPVLGTGFKMVSWFQPLQTSQAHLTSLDFSNQASLSPSKLEHAGLWRLHSFRWCAINPHLHPLVTMHLFGLPFLTQTIDHCFEVIWVASGETKPNTVSHVYVKCKSN